LANRARIAPKVAAAIFTALAAFFFADLVLSTNVATGAHRYNHDKDKEGNLDGIADRFHSPHPTFSFIGPDDMAQDEIDTRM
jgi:hypothetical protein